MRISIIRGLFGAGCFWIFVFAMPLAAGPSRIWVLDMNPGPKGTIQIIDPATNKIVQTINGIGYPHGVVFSPDGSLAYVSSEDERATDALYVVDTKTGTILKRAPLNGRRANLDAITKDGRQLLVCVAPPRDEKGIVIQTDPGFLDIVDTTSLQILKAFPVRGHDCYITPDGKYWLAGTSPNLVNLLVIDVATQQILWKLYYKEGVGPIAMETNPDGSVRRLFVTPVFNKFRQISVVDFATHKELARVALPDEPGPSKIAKAAGLEREEGQPVHGLEVSPDGKILAIGCRNANAVFFYSLPELKLLGHFSTVTIEGAPPGENGGDPVWLTFSPDGEKLYVASGAADVVQVVDVKTLKELARIAVGRQPNHVFVGP